MIHRTVTFHLAADAVPGSFVAGKQAERRKLILELRDETYIAAHTEGFAALKAMVRDYTPRFVTKIGGIEEQDLVEAARWFGPACAALSLSKIGGIEESDLVEAARWFGPACTALSLYCEGLKQSSSGAVKNTALINACRTLFATTDGRLCRRAARRRATRKL